MTDFIYSAANAATTISLAKRARIRDLRQQSAAQRQLVGELTALLADVPLAVP